MAGLGFMFLGTNLVHELFSGKCFFPGCHFQALEDWVAEHSSPWKLQASPAQRAAAAKIAAAAREASVGNGNPFQDSVVFLAG